MTPNACRATAPIGSGTQKHSVALSGDQKHSVAISGTQCHSPAVSAIKIDWPRHLSDEAIESRVVPGDGCTTCLCSPRTRLMKDDLPTFGRPIT